MTEVCPHGAELKHIGGSHWDANAPMGAVAHHKRRANARHAHALEVDSIAIEDQISLFHGVVTWKAFRKAIHRRSSSVTYQARDHRPGFVPQAGFVPAHAEVRTQMTLLIGCNVIVKARRYWWNGGSTRLGNYLRRDAALTDKDQLAHRSTARGADA
jgi:hypothetical protein